MESIFLRVVNMSLSAAAVIAVVVLLRLVLRGAPKKWRYLLWSAAAFRLCCPVSFRAFFSIFRLRPPAASVNTVSATSGVGAMNYIPRTASPVIPAKAMPVTGASGPVLPVPVTSAPGQAVSSPAVSVPAQAAASVDPIQVWLAVFQVVLCGGFFALSLSDALDLRANFSMVRAAMDFFYDAAFLSIALYTLFFAKKESDAWFRGVVWACAVLIAAQCFLFPYETENDWKRIYEAAEGAAVFALLVILTQRPRDAAFGQKAMICVISFELAVSVINVIRPAPGVADDFQKIDVPMNYAALFMRPVLFSSLALAYRAWLDRRGIGLPAKDADAAEEKPGTDAGNVTAAEPGAADAPEAPADRAGGAEEPAGAAEGQRERE